MKVIKGFIIGYFVHKHYAPFWQRVTLHTIENYKERQALREASTEPTPLSESVSKLVEDLRASAEVNPTEPTQAYTDERRRTGRLSQNLKLRSPRYGAVQRSRIPDPRQPEEEPAPTSNQVGKPWSLSNKDREKPWESTAVVIEEGNKHWDMDFDVFKTNIRRLQTYWNHQLKDKGLVTLNQVYDDLGFDTTSKGSHIGWRLDEASKRRLAAGVNAIIFDTEFKTPPLKGTKHSAIIHFNVVYLDD